MQPSSETHAVVEQSAGKEDPHRARRPHALDLTIGLALKNRRQGLGFSQQELAKQCDLSFQQIQKYERGTNRIPASRLFTLAAALKTTPTELLRSAWAGPSADPKGELRQRLAEAASHLSCDELQALVTLAERLAQPSSALTP